MQVPGSANALMLGGQQDYRISRSLRFNSADSAYLNRTPASAGNRKTWTWSGWVKRSALSSNSAILSNGDGTASNGYFLLRFNSADTIYVVDTPDNAATTCEITWNSVFRDTSAWYHVVLCCNTTDATSANRMRLYINGVENTNSTITTAPSLNGDLNINRAVSMALGRFNYSANQYFNGYLTEINFIDGQALTPSSFGETDLTTGVWKPKKYAGTYGTNGFYLNFSDNSGTTATTLGKDSSGNGNNWTPNNFSVTAGAGNDSLVDVPTLWGSDTGAGGEVRGNYATLNPITASNSNVTLSNGNLQVQLGTTAQNRTIVSTIAVSSGKWYFEGTVSSTSQGGDVQIGVLGTNNVFTGNYYIGQASNGYSYEGNAIRYNNGSGVSYGATYTTNDVIGVALDLDAGTLVFYKNGVSQGTAYTGLSGQFYFGLVGGSSAPTWFANFGQRPFAYTAPSGFKALCTTNLPEPSIKQGSKQFNVALYTGNGSTQSITGVGFQPDLVWIKQRDASTYNHNLYDSVRGANKALFSELTSAESTYTDRLMSFDSDGFSLGSGAGTNSNGSTRVAWNWKANGTGVSNTAGSITSTVSANTSSGFSIVTHSGSGANGTVGHGLGVAPKMMITKNRTSGTPGWIVYHASLGISYYLVLNTTGAQDNRSVATVWNSTAPTSSVFSVGTDAVINASSNNYVTYCFSEVAGYSSFGSYTGNGSTDGPFVFCGFRPRYVLIKRTDVANSWVILDSARDTYNVTEKNLYAESSGAEATYAAEKLDFLSNGFKQRQTGVSMNANGGTYVFAAFAENPFKYSLAR